MGREESRLFRTERKKRKKIARREIKGGKQFVENKKKIKSQKGRKKGK